MEKMGSCFGNWSALRWKVSVNIYIFNETTSWLLSINHKSWMKRRDDEWRSSSEVGGRQRWEPQSVRSGGCTVAKEQRAFTRQPYWRRNQKAERAAVSIRWWLTRGNVRLNSFIKWGSRQMKEEESSREQAGSGKRAQDSDGFFFSVILSITHWESIRLAVSGWRWEKGLEATDNVPFNSLKSDRFLKAPCLAVSVAELSWSVLSLGDCINWWSDSHSGVKQNRAEQMRFPPRWWHEHAHEKRKGLPQSCSLTP